MDRCSEHDRLIETIHKIDKTTTELSVKINGSIDDIEKHIARGQAWRLAICGVTITLIVQIVVTAFLTGRLVKTVEIYTARLDVVESIIRIK